MAPPWMPFWAAYRDHRKKLQMALTWASILNPELVSATDVTAHLAFVSAEARRLDLLKQESQYSGFNGAVFTVPVDTAIRDEAIILGVALESLCSLLREQYPPDLPEDEFLELISEK